MDAREQKEEKNKRIGWMVSVSVQLALLVLFYFLIAWKAPFPPNPEYGIELGFTTSAGSSPASSSTQSSANETEQVAPDETRVETTEPTPQNEIQDSDVIEQPVVEESEVEVTPESTITSDNEQADSNQSPEELADVEEVNEPVPQPVEADNPTEGSNETQAVEPEIDDRAIYGNQGTDTGNEEGASLALAGWIWDNKPIPDDQSEESGKIVYRIVVDQEGYLVKVETITSTVSPSVERKYRAAVEKLTFSKTTQYKPAPRSTGTLTFIIKTR